MPASEGALVCCLENDEVHINGPANDEVRITFRRTIRVPDNSEMLELPPNMGKMGLYKVS